MVIYTRTGDKGKTSLASGERVSKCNARVRANGDIDELNALLGVAIGAIKHKKTLNALFDIQAKLFEMGAIVSLSKMTISLTLKDSTVLEKLIDYFEKQNAPLRNFILPGGKKGAALLHLARTVCRRAERSLVEIKANDVVLAYINRLSDLLFVMARAENNRSKGVERIWKS